MEDLWKQLTLLQKKLRGCSNFLPKQAKLFIFTNKKLICTSMGYGVYKRAIRTLLSELAG
jgi:hypothetical protein